MIMNNTLLEGSLGFFKSSSGASCKGNQYVIEFFKEALEYTLERQASFAFLPEKH